MRESESVSSKEARVQALPGRECPVTAVMAVPAELGKIFIAKVRGCMCRTEVLLPREFFYFCGGCAGKTTASSTLMPSTKTGVQLAGALAGFFDQSGSIYLGSGRPDLN
jgi:hypothetical protein